MPTPASYAEDGVSHREDWEGQRLASTGARVTAARAQARA